MIEYQKYFKWTAIVLGILMTLGVIFSNLFLYITCFISLAIFFILKWKYIIWKQKLKNNDNDNESKKNSEIDDFI